MSNETIVYGNYENIQGVRDGKKIKVPDAKIVNIRKAAKTVKAPEINEVIAEPKEVVTKVEEKAPEVVEEPRKEEMPLYMNSINNMNNEPQKPQSFEFDGNAIKEKVGENYKNLANFDKKMENKTDAVQKLNLNDKIVKFEKLLDSDVIIMQDKIEMVKKIYDRIKGKLQSAKEEQAKCAEAYRTATKEVEAAKFDIEIKKKRTEEMNRKDCFSYLTVGENEVGEIVKAIRDVNESLKGLYNVNQSLYKDAAAKIEKYESDKKEINKSSEKVGSEIHKYVEELTKFINEKTPLLEEIIKVNNQYKTMEKESDKLIKDEYEELTREESKEIGINLNTGNQDVIPNINTATMNDIFENFGNFRQAASEGGNEAAVGIYEEPVSYRRAA